MNEYEDRPSKRFRRSRLYHEEPYEPIAARTRRMHHTQSINDTLTQTIGRPRHASMLMISNTHPNIIRNNQSEAIEEEEGDSTIIKWSGLKKIKTRQLKSSIHYGVSWTSAQKEELFQTVERYGVHNLAHFADRVTNKSMIECVSYMTNVQRAAMELYHGLEQTGSLHLWNIYPWQHPTARCIPRRKVLKEDEDAEALALIDDDTYRVSIQKTDPCHESTQHKNNHEISDIREHNEPREAPQSLDRKKTLLMLELFHLRHALTLSQYVFYRHQPDCKVAIGYDTFIALYTELRHWLTKLIGQIIALVYAKQTKSDAKGSLWIDWKIIKLALELRGDLLNRRSFLKRVYSQLYEEDVIDDLPDETVEYDLTCDETNIHWIDIEQLARLHANRLSIEETTLTVGNDDDTSTALEDTNAGDADLITSDTDTGDDDNDDDEYRMILAEEQELELCERQLDEEYDDYNNID